MCKNILSGRVPISSPRVLHNPSTTSAPRHPKYFYSDPTPSHSVENPSPFMPSAYSYPRARLTQSPIKNHHNHNLFCWWVTEISVCLCSFYMLPCVSYNLLCIPAPLILDPELRPTSNPTLFVPYQYFCPAFPLTMASLFKGFNLRLLTKYKRLGMLLQQMYIQQISSEKPLLWWTFANWWNPFMR